MIFFVKLFFFDDGASTRKQEQTGSNSEENDTESVDNPVEHTKNVSITQPAVANANRSAWADPDDERICVSVASDKRLRKLRVTESEDVVAGNDYENRLRRQ